MLLLHIKCLLLLSISFFFLFFLVFKESKTFSYALKGILGLDHWGHILKVKLEKRFTFLKETQVHYVGIVLQWTTL